MLISVAHSSKRSLVPREDRSVKYFHPDYPRDSILGGAVIQTSTGLCFRFPLDMLASVSDLFNDASEVSHSHSHFQSYSESTNDEPLNQVITLDILRPEGLHVILSVLHPIMDHHTHEAKVDRLRRISAEDIIEGFQVAEILGIATLAQLLLPFFSDPFTRFALASGSNDLIPIQEMAVRTFESPFSSMSRYAETILNTLDPSLFVRLRGLHDKRSKIPKTILPTLMSGQAMMDGMNDFTKSCRKRDWECAAIRSVKGRSWAQLRNRAASDVWNGLVKTSALPCQWKEISDWALEGSCKGCQVCRKRLSECLGKALEAAVDGLPKEV